MHSYIYALCALTLTQYLVMVDANMSLHSTSLLLKVDQQDRHQSEELVTVQNSGAALNY